MYHDNKSLNLLIPLYSKIVLHPSLSQIRFTFSTIRINPIILCTLLSGPISLNQLHLNLIKIDLKYLNKGFRGLLPSDFFA